MNKKYILTSLILCMILPMAMALGNNPTIAPNGECYVEEPIPLYKDWNLIALVWNNGSYPLTGDRNVSVYEGLNLLGNSGVRKFNVNDITFTNATGTYNFADSGLSDISVYRDATTDELQTTGILDNPQFIYPQEGFWITSTSAGNITLPNVGGAESGESYDVTKLRFSNGSLELSFADAKNNTYSWIDDLQYWTFTGYNYDFEVLSSGNINIYQGYFISSAIDNLTLIRQNTTEPCKQKFPKCYNTDSNGKCKVKVYNTNSNSKGKIKLFVSHIWRLIGEVKNYETI